MVSDSIKTMMDDVLASYEHGVKGITPIFSVATMLLNANGEQETGRIQLRETLAQNGNLRKADFDRMLTAVTQRGNNQGKELSLLLRNFLARQQEMIEQLGGHFAQIRACMESDDIENIKQAFTRIKKIVAQQEQARQELETKLAEQGKEEQKIQTGIKLLLQKGRELQIRDFKEMLVGIKRQSKDRIEQRWLRREAVCSNAGRLQRTAFEKQKHKEVTMSITDGMENMTADIIASHDIRTKEVGQLLADARTDHKAMSKELAAKLEGFRKENDNRHDSVNKMLMDYHKDHAEMSAATRSHLRGFVKDLKGRLRKEADNRHDSVNKMLTAYRTDIRKAGDIWSKMTRTLANKKGNSGQAALSVIRAGQKVGTAKESVVKTQKRKTRKK